MSNTTNQTHAQTQAAPDSTPAQAAITTAKPTPTVQDATNLRIGIDVGSTTVKLAILDAACEIKYSIYQRHHADVRATVQLLMPNGTKNVGNMSQKAMRVADQVP